MRITVPFASALLLGLSLPACAESQSDDVAGLTEACIESIARVALGNTKTNELASNFVGPLGLTPTSDPNAPPFRTKQTEFHAPDGTVHYFAVEDPEWTKATLIRLTPTGDYPRLQLFVINRASSLLAAGVIEDRKLRVLDVNDPDVQREYEAEQAVFTAAGPPSACATG